MIILVKYENQIPMRLDGRMPDIPIAYRPNKDNPYNDTGGRVTNNRTILRRKRHHTLNVIR